MGALVVVFLWIGVNAMISYFQNKKEVKKPAKREKTVVKTYPKNYNFDLFYDMGETLQKSA